MALGILLGLPFLGALIVLSLSLLGVRSAALPRLVGMAILALALGVLGAITFSGIDTPALSIPWMPSLGLHMNIWLDGPAMFFAWLVLGMGLLVFQYAGHYMDPTDSPARFYGTLLFFTGAMLGVVMSRNMLLMFLFWELTSVSSFILIGHWHEREAAREGAQRALIVTGLGGLCLLAGIAALFVVLGMPTAPDAMDWDAIWAQRDAIIAHPLATTALVLCLLGAFTKSAQFPFHFWLPGAMEAPTPVSAFLHAATMVKAGIYLLGRLFPLFGNHELWLVLVATTGLATMLVGGFMAVLSKDLKQLLAHSTVSQLGLLTAYYGFGFGKVGGDEKLPLDLLLVASHAIFKGALFMLVGVIDHGAHTRDWTRLGGLRKSMPATWILTTIGALSMAGIPLTLGFVAKELFLHQAFYVDTHSSTLKYSYLAAVMIGSGLTFAYSLRLAVSPFFGAPRDHEIHAHEGGFGILAAPALLCVLVVLGGVYTPALEAPIAALVQSDYYGTASGFVVGFFHHVDKLFWSFVGIVALGVLIHANASRFEKLYVGLGHPRPFLLSYNTLFLRAAPALANFTAMRMQPSSLQKATALTVAAIAVVGGVALVRSFEALPQQFSFGVAELVPASVVALIAASAIATLCTTNLILRLVLMAPIGLFVSLFFVFYQAPDLAMTQLVIEAATLVVFLLVLMKLPQRLPADSPASKPWAFVVAAAMALLMGAMTWMGSVSPHRSIPNAPGVPTLADYYLANAKSPAADAPLIVGDEVARAAGGNNAVNVIIVDFRGFDTLGEISVLGVAALGILALFSLGRAKTPPAVNSSEIKAELPGREESFLGRKPWPAPSLLLQETTRVVPAILLLFAVILYWAGHNAPGGGFIAGLLTAIAIAIIVMGFKRDKVPTLHRFDYARVIAIGLMLSILTGLGAVAFGYPFLTSTYAYFNIPLAGKTELATAALFDLGIYVLVVGVVLLITTRLAKD